MKEAKDCTLLIVDDEEILRETIAFDFKRKGFNVLTAENGLSAFGMIRENKVDLVISDLRMPNGDGLGLLRDITSARDLPHVPKVVLVTGFADASAEECVGKGAFRVIQKPFDRKLLMRTVLEALGMEEPRPPGTAKP